MKKEINVICYVDITELCNELTSDEKREIVEEIIHDIDADDIYESLSSSQKESLRGKFANEETKYRYDKLYYNEKDPVNIALLSLLGKSRMLTKDEYRDIT